MTNNDILTKFILSDGSLQQSINNMIPLSYRDDFRSHLYLQILEIPNKKLKEALKKGYFKYYIIRIICNTNGINSSFWKETRNHGFWEPNMVLELDTTYETNQEEYDYDKDNEYVIRNAQVDQILKSIHWYHQELFRLHRQGNTYRQIEKLTGINYQSVRLSILKTIDTIKKNL